jgi:hypothetical protein
MKDTVRHRLNIEVTAETKRAIDMLPYGMRGMILAGLCKRLAKEIESKGWENVLWLRNGTFDFVGEKDGLA